MKLRPDDLYKIKQKMRPTFILRISQKKAKITVHMGTCGIASGANKIMEAFSNLIRENNIKNIVITNSGCAGLCSHEPMVTVQMNGFPPVKYIDLSEEKVEKIFFQHILEGEIVEEYALAIGSERVL